MTRYEKLEKGLSELSNSQLMELWNIAMDGQRYGDAKVYENDESFWDDTNLSISEAMYLVHNNSVDLDDGYVKVEDGDYETANDVEDLIEMDVLINYLLSAWENGERDLFKEYNLEVAISLHEIIEIIGKTISGLTHAIEDCIEGKNESVLANLEEQQKRLSELKEEIKELKWQEEEDK